MTPAAANGLALLLELSGYCYPSVYVTTFMFVTSYVTIWVIKQSAVQLYKLSPSMDVCIIDAIKPIYTDVHGSAYLSGNATADHLKLTIMRRSAAFPSNISRRNATPEFSEQAERRRPEARGVLGVLKSPP